jgi:hypothetical protein
MPLPIWAEAVLLLIVFCVVAPRIAAVIGYAAWRGTPKHWDRSMYWTAFAFSMVASLSLMFVVSRMVAGLLEVALGLLSVLLLFGVGGGCFIDIFVYTRGKGPTWRDATPKEGSTDGEP